MQTHSGNAIVIEDIGQFFSKRPGSGEHEGSTTHTSQIHHDLSLVPLLHHKNAVIDGRGLLIFTLHLKHGGVGHEFAHDIRNTSIQGGGEQQALSFTRGGAQNSLQGFDESQLRHVVSFIHHGNHDLGHI